MTEWTLGVLAGGGATRMGGEKPMLPFGDGSLLEWTLERCAPDGAEALVAVGSRDLPLPHRARAVADRHPGAGPLAGIHVLLEACPTRWLIVIPCDMPWLSRDVLTSLLDAVRSRAADCRIGWYRDTSGPQTFPLALHVDALESVARHLADGRNRVRTLGEAMPAAEIGASTALEDARVFRNVNTPDDLEAARGELL